jgi:hypothetical protein
MIAFILTDFPRKIKRGEPICSNFFQFFLFCATFERSAPRRALI